MKKKNRRIASKIKRLNIVLAKIAPFNKCQKNIFIFNYENRTLSSLFNTRCRASALLEASLIFPLFLYAVFSLIYIILTLNTRMLVDKAAYNTVRSLGKYSYLAANLSGDKGEKEAKLNNLEILAGAKSILYSELGDEFGQNHHIVGGTAGITVLGSKLDEKTGLYEIRINYLIKNPFDIFGLGISRISQTYSQELWLGKEKAGEWNQNDQDTIVYITNTGEAYHKTRSCWTINPKPRMVAVAEIASLRSESGEKYRPCEVCKKNSSQGVYITNYGNRYHSSSTCREILKDVYAVKLSSVGGRRKCKECWK